MIFLDTSVLVAVAQVNHEHHAPSLELWNGCSSREIFCSAHTMAELYSTFTAMPPALRLAPRDAVRAIEIFLERLTPVDLAACEYVETLRSAASIGCSGGAIYDALHVACARKIGAEWVYTWNIRNFQMVAPDLAGRIRKP